MTEDVITVLRHIGVVEAAREVLDPGDVAAETALTRARIDEALVEIERFGLAIVGAGDATPPMLLNAGRQLLAMGGGVEDSVLAFLPDVIDDLHARRALLHGGTILVDEFRVALLADGGLEFARGLVPAAFAVAVDDALVIDLFAALVALLARLSNQAPAACVAEELVAVALIASAQHWLEGEVDAGELSPAAAREASAALHQLFELFEDDDVLRLFEMREPGDAAVDGASVEAEHLGVVDQRIESWFVPFAGVPRTGHLDGEAPRP